MAQTSHFAFRIWVGTFQREEILEFGHPTLTAARRHFEEIKLWQRKSQEDTIAEIYRGITLLDQRKFEWLRCEERLAAEEKMWPSQRSIFRQLDKLPNTSQRGD